jgi:hypothetical protein
MDEVKGTDSHIQAGPHGLRAIHLQFSQSLKGPFEVTWDSTYPDTNSNWVNIIGAEGGCAVFALSTYPNEEGEQFLLALAEARYA